MFAIHISLLKLDPPLPFGWFKWYSYPCASAIPSIFCRAFRSWTLSPGCLIYPGSVGTASFRRWEDPTADLMRTPGQSDAGSSGDAAKRDASFSTPGSARSYIAIHNERTTRNGTLA
ncbi:hypothetical protein HUJ04_013382 [Dendroctonus ponderosae]|nr:hypothetical protein HUJ04_013382 [Dendroctonus ponderosae]